MVKQIEDSFLQTIETSLLLRNRMLRRTCDLVKIIFSVDAIEKSLDDSIEGNRILIFK